MKRLDVALVDFGLAPSRAKAQQMIEAGEVELLSSEGWQVARKANARVTSAEVIRLVPTGQTLKFVSRGGLKLEGALDHLKLDVHGWRVLDVGISTGGFTDCLLQRGAASVCGFDVGRGQLHERLKVDTRVRAFEGVHLKDAPAHAELRDWLGAGVHLAVADLSFISIQNLLPVLARLLPNSTRILLLVKPQFEVGPDGLGKGGIVRDEGLFAGVRLEVLQGLAKHGFLIDEYFPSPLKGQDGNQEFFVFGSRDHAPGGMPNLTEE